MQFLLTTLVSILVTKFNLSTIDKIYLKCDVFDGSVVNGLIQPLLFSFNLDKPNRFKVFSEPEAIH